MANVVDENFDYTYNGTILKEIFYKPSESTPALDTLARIIPGSQFKIQMTLAGILSKILKSGKGCITTLTGDGLNLVNQTVELNPFRMELQECAEDFEGSVGNWIAEDALKSGVDRNDISGTEVERIIDRLIEDALRRDVFRIFSFGDTTSGSSDYDGMDGLWTTLIANSGGGTSYCVNKAASIGTGALAADAAIGFLKTVVENSANILDEVPVNMKKIDVTRTIYDNLVTTYESVSTGSDLQVTFQTDGIPTVRYRGILVNKIASWDTSLADADNPLNGTVEHLILYTTKDNHVIGVGDNADLNNFRGWYSVDDDIYNFRSKMRLGYNYIHCDLQTIAF